MIRLYTEDVNRDGIESILHRHVDGYTLITAIGSWKGEKEHSLIIELFEDSKAHSIASEICELNNQDAVAIQHIQANIEMIYRKDTMPVIDDFMTSDGTDAAREQIKKDTQPRPVDRELEKAFLSGMDENTDHAFFNL